MARSLKLSVVALFLVAVASGVVAWAAQDEHVPLSVSIAVPLHKGKRTLTLYRPENHFHVVIKNISTHQVHLWREWCSWGYFNLRFEVTDDKGKSWLIKKKAKGWDRNGPDFATIDPNGNLFIDVTFDPAVWENPPLPDKGKSHILNMRAIYEITESDEAKKSKVWSGRIVSEKNEYTIWR